jgi:hypothetical protein
MGAQMGALITEGTTLFGGQAIGCCTVDTINTTTGVATAGSALTGTNSVFWGFADKPVTSEVPEPSAVALFATVLVAVGLLTQRRRLSPTR